MKCLNTSMLFFVWKKKKRGQLELRTTPFTVSRYVRVVSLHAEPWPMNRDNRRHHTGCRTQSRTSKIKFLLSPFDVVHYCILKIHTTCFDRSNPTMLAFVHGLVFCFLFVVDWWPKEKNSYWLPNSTQIWFTSKSVLTQK